MRQCHWPGSYDKEAALELYPVLYDKLFKRTNPKTGKKTFPDIEKYFYVEVTPAACRLSTPPHRIGRANLPQYIGFRSPVTAAHARSACADSPRTLCVRQIVPERNRSFPVVDFVDTPGMTDEKSDYHFEVEDVILEMAQHKADLILVFLDPRGQAFCQRTIETAAKLFQIVPEKVKVFLSRVSHSQRAVPKIEPNVL